MRSAGLPLELPTAGGRCLWSDSVGSVTRGFQAQRFHPSPPAVIVSPLVAGSGLSLQRAAPGTRSQGPAECWCC